MEPDPGDVMKLVDDNVLDDDDSTSTFATTTAGTNGKIGTSTTTIRPKKHKAKEIKTEESDPLQVQTPPLQLKVIHKGITCSQKFQPNQ